MKLILFVFCMIFASCSTRHYFADDVVGKYIDKTGSYELYLSDNGLCSITFRTADKGQGFWYIDNDSVICMFEKAQLIDLLSFGRAVEGKINFAILGNKLKNTEFFFNRKKLHTDKNNETVKWNAFTYHPDGVGVQFQQITEKTAQHGEDIGGTLLRHLLSGDMVEISHLCMPILHGFKTG